MPFTETSQQQSQSQSQEQILSARQMQSLELLHLPLFELQDRIIRELAANPLIEDAASPSEEPIPEASTVPETSESGDFPDGGDDAVPENLGEDWFDEIPIPEESADDGAAERRERFFDSLVYEKDLSDHLLEELRFAGLTPEEEAVAESIVGSIDEAGYLVTPTADIAMASGAGMDTVERVLGIVQGIAPAGVGARDLAECLLLQLERRGEDTPLLRKILNEHLDDIGHNRLPQTAKALGISLDELKAGLEKIRSLNPHPAPARESVSGEGIVPELEIVPDGDGFKVVENGEHLPRLRLSESYRKLLDDPELSAADRGYIKEKLASARELMRALAMRRSTLVRIAEVIAVEQADFLRHGVGGLRPMTMKHLADMLEVHETTVSRAVNGKYVATPQGVFELRYFFSGGYRSDDGGGEVSSRAIKDRIREIIAGEDGSRPLSDEKISAMLKDAGFSVARRTVAKYREEQNILPTHLRRKH